ncbi:hypothetical protein FGIG_00016 [Fasciola gigantica]|uniref:Ribosome biogenesis protein NOP53 n=1 Tax=Fasciola gigantica TaxID=46835 RepID=A0A504YM73_FASGI|nr:hypothetical protein FGIG_00016 [Fasciola gigantica]
MKKLGKNKKKQWKHCYTDLEDRLDAVQKQRQISKEGFLLGKIEKKKHRIIKGDKNSAKAFPDVPSVSDGQPRLKKYTVQKRIRSAVDLWESVPKKTIPKRDKPKLVLPAPGQSYNPSLEDHHTMLSALAKSELEKRRREAKTDRFLKGLGGSRPTTDPIEEAKSFIHNLTTDPKLQASSVEQEEEEEVNIPRKPKKVNLEKRMAVELENIPKLLKEIKRENQARSQRRKLLKTRREHRKNLRQMELDVPFQLPNELVPALRKLTPECDLLHEIEKRKNKVPRARKTLGLNKNTKSYERR